MCDAIAYSPSSNRLRDKHGANRLFEHYDKDMITVTVHSIAGDDYAVTVFRAVPRGCGEFSRPLSGMGEHGGVGWRAFP